MTEYIAKLFTVETFRQFGLTGLIIFLFSYMNYLNNQYYRDALGEERSWVHDRLITAIDNQARAIELLREELKK